MWLFEVFDVLCLLWVRIVSRFFMEIFIIWCFGDMYIYFCCIFFMGFSWVSFLKYFIFRFYRLYLCVYCYFGFF